MINIEAVYQDSMKVAPQYANMWDFSIVDDWTENSGISTFKVESTSLPFPSLTVEKRVTGHHYYSGYELPESFSVTFREDKNFSVYTYFRNWQKQVFDLKTGTFISGANVPHKKTGSIRFTAFENGEEVPTKVFTLHGLRFLGFEDVSLNYTEGTQLTITVNFAMDLATDES